MVSIFFKIKHFPSLCYSLFTETLCSLQSYRNIIVLIRAEPYNWRIFKETSQLACALLAKKYQAVEKGLPYLAICSKRVGIKGNDCPGCSNQIAFGSVSAPVLHARECGGNEEAEVLQQQREQLWQQLQQQFRVGGEWERIVSEEARASPV